MNEHVEPAKTQLHGCAAVGLQAVGLFNSIMFPTIFTLAIDGLGENTAQGSGILCKAFVLSIACNLCIVYYGGVGAQVDRPARVPAALA